MWLGMRSQTWMPRQVEVKTQPQARCPIRPGDPCSLCVPGASGPQDCGLVYLVMSDPDLRDRLDRLGLKKSLGGGSGMP